MGEIGPQVQLPDPDGELLIDGWRVEAARNRISRGDETVRLEPRTMAVLLCLVRKPGEVVTRQALEWHVWRGGVIGYDVQPCRNQVA